MKIKTTLFLLFISSLLLAQNPDVDELDGYNLFLLPAPQINITLSLNSSKIVNPNTGFSVTPGAKTIDMVAAFNESQLLQPKPYTPNSNTDYRRLRFKSNDRKSGFQLNGNDDFAREFRSTNPAFFEANRNTALHRSYNPLSCYNNGW
ncbi:hypothetical protein [Nonlabens sp.]|uniref:hypothetical protein n=1 Tax=Nonlabens sp. TaxID=1888209 RepID=UPI003F6A5181